MDYKKYIPSEEVGEYEAYKRREKKKGGLYPLGEEGEYGPPPSALPPPLPGYKKRERKPKVYASYAVSSECEAHGDVLSRNESDRGHHHHHHHHSAPPAPKPKQPARRASSYTRTAQPVVTPQRKERSFSQPRQRSNSFRQPSPAPTNGQGYSGRADWAGSLRGGEPCHAHQRRGSTPRQRKTSTRSSHRESVSPQRKLSVSPERAVTPEWQKKAERRSMSSDGMSQRSSQSSTDWGYTSYNNFTASSKGGNSTNSTNNTRSSSSSYSKYSGGLKDSSYDESYENDYSSSFSYSGSKNYSSSSSTGGRMALASLKTPEIQPWDNMGILGLSSKMFSDSSTAKAGAFASIMRKQSVSSHVM